MHLILWRNLVASETDLLSNFQVGPSHPHHTDPFSEAYSSGRWMPAITRKHCSGFTSGIGDLAAKDHIDMLVGVKRMRANVRVNRLMDLLSWHTARDTISLLSMPESQFPLFAAHASTMPSSQRAPASAPFQKRSRCDTPSQRFHVRS
jgi:hypothetical protein